MNIDRLVYLYRIILIDRELFEVIQKSRWFYDKSDKSEKER